MLLIKLNQIKQLKESNNFICNLFLAYENDLETIVNC